MLELVIPIPRKALDPFHRIKKKMGPVLNLEGEKRTASALTIVEVDSSRPIQKKRLTQKGKGKGTTIQASPEVAPRESKENSKPPCHIKQEAMVDFLCHRALRRTKNFPFKIFIHVLSFQKHWALSNMLFVLFLIARQARSELQQWKSWNMFSLPSYPNQNWEQSRPGCQCLDCLTRCQKKITWTLTLLLDLMWPSCFYHV